MAHFIIDPLEVIKIGEDHGERRSIAMRALHLAPQPLHNDAVVQQSRQSVVLREVTHLFARSNQLGFFPLQILCPCFDCVLQLTLLPHQLSYAPPPGPNKQNQAKDTQAALKINVLPPERNYRESE